ncbi:MAG: hypothetical protein COV66_03095 [Nitrospinae bacterium CG11_big_fil_rev_8_21_14_0_20_45_15]|nr:MAG: hypothetical protein COV66_03095 [Nitrospinae bacterium CG11_big_fil_rev_8_21_14_0_20_45_15]
MVLRPKSLFYCSYVLGPLISISVLFLNISSAEAGIFDWFTFSSNPEVAQNLQPSSSEPLTVEQIKKEKERIQGKKNRIKTKRRLVLKKRTRLEEKIRDNKEILGVPSSQENRQIKLLDEIENELFEKEKSLLAEEIKLQEEEKKRIAFDQNKQIESVDTTGADKQNSYREEPIQENEFKRGEDEELQQSPGKTKTVTDRELKRKARRLYLGEQIKLERDQRRNSEELDGNIRFGRLQVTPGLELKQKYDDNIFYEADKRFANGTREGKSEDLISVISPYIKIIRKRAAGERFGLSLLYRANQEKFADLSALDNLQHDARGELDFSLRGNRIRGKLFTTFLQTQDLSSFDKLQAVESSSVIATNFNPRTSRTDYKFGTSVDFSKSDRFLFRLLTYLRNINFEPSLETEDREDFNTSLSTFWKWTPLTRLGVKYDYRNLHYNSNSTFNLDSNTHSASLAVEFEPTALISGTFELGYVTREFIGSTAGRDSIRFLMDLEYKLTDRTRFSFGGRRSIEDSSFSTINAYVFTAVSATWNQDWTSKISTKSTIGFQNQDYSEKVADTKNSGGSLKQRSDNGFNLDLAASYQIQKTLRAELEYRFNKNDSNFNELDFEKNSVFMTLKMAF